MSKIGKLKQRLAIMIDFAGTKAPVTRNKWIDDDIVFANPEKYDLKKPTRMKPSNWKPDPPSPEHEAWVQEQYDNFDKVVGDIKAYNKDVETEKNLQELLDTETESYESSVTRKPKKHRPKKPTQQDRIDVMEARLKQRIAQVRLAADYSMEGWKTYGPDMDAIKAFQNKRTYKSGKGVVNRKTGTKKGNYKFRTDGRSLFVWDNEVARHSRDGGFDVSSAGYNTPLTMSTLNAIGVNAREGKYDPEGKNRIALGSEFLEINDPSWVHVSPDKVQAKPVMYDDRRGLEKGRGSTGVKRPNQAEFSSATIARERVEAGIKKGNPPSKTNIQPTKRDKFGDSQEQIDKITGLKTKTPRKTLGVKAHHLLDYAGVGKDLPVEHGGIMLPDDYHDFITQFEKGTSEGNQRRLRQMQSKLRLKIAEMRQRNISRGVPRIAMGALARNVMQKAKGNPLFMRTEGGYVYDEDNNVFLDATKRADALAIRKKHGKEGQWLGINSITDTTKGPVEKNEMGLRQIERELNEIEDVQKDRPILGGYKNSIEASYPVIGDEKNILGRLNKNQESSLGIDPEGTAYILYPDGKRDLLTQD